MNTVFHNMFLLYDRGHIYGNKSVLLKKLGRLLLVYSPTSGGLSCYVLNATDIPISVYHAQRLKDECLTKTKTFKEAFGILIHDRPLTEETDVTFQMGLDGSFSIRFKKDPIKIERGGEFYNMLAREMKEGADRDTCVFFDLVEYKHVKPKVRVLIHSGTPPAAQGFDAVINLETAGCLVGCIPYYWEICYDRNIPGIEYNPVLLRLNRETLRPLS